MARLILHATRYVRPEPIKSPTLRNYSSAPRVIDVTHTADMRSRHAYSIQYPVARVACRQETRARQLRMFRQTLRASSRPWRAGSGRDRIEPIQERLRGLYPQSRGELWTLKRSAPVSWKRTQRSYRLTCTWDGPRLPAGGRFAAYRFLTNLPGLRIAGVQGGSRVYDPTRSFPQTDCKQEL